MRSEELRRFVSVAVKAEQCCSSVINKELIMKNQDLNYENWKLETDADNILWLTLDRKDSPVNTLNYAVFSELNSILDKILQSPPKGVVILSGKEKGFIAGADVSQFIGLKTQKEAFDLIRGGQLIINKLESL